MIPTGFNSTEVNSNEKTILIHRFNDLHLVLSL